jgi:transposase
MSFPKWVLKFKETKTEIKKINGAYYKYSVSYKYDPQKKRTDKITGVLLGKITQEEGFVASEKNAMRAHLGLNKIDIKNYGLFHLFSSLLEDEWASLQRYFPKEVCELLFSFAMFRWAYNTPIKRASYYYHHDFCSQIFETKSTNDKAFSDALKFVGERRSDVARWMKTMLGGDEKTGAEFVMMDSTHVFSKSELLTVNAKGYNPDFDFEKQIRLMYLFSAQVQKPVYYRLINGNITDIKSMALCVQEMNIKNVIYIADKGFYSKKNVEMMRKEQLQYIIPLQRNSKCIDYKPLQKANFKKQLSYFLYQQRIIWYYSYNQGTEQYITFMDDRLKTQEEADYVARMDTMPELYTQKKFMEKLKTFGTLTLSRYIETEKSGEEIYRAYKQRNEIETIFDSYKNFLRADLTYMQNRYVLEGWLTANFIAMIAYHKLYVRLREIKKLKHHAPKDIIETAKSIYMLNINNQWNISEISKKDFDLFKKINIDYLNKRS